MKCEYCDKEIKNGNKYCDFCGAKVDFADNKADDKKEKKKKKGITPGKVIFIVFLIATIIVLSIYGIGCLIFKHLSEFEENSFSGSYSEEEFEDMFEDYYDDFFDGYFGGNYSYDDEYGKTDYEGTENFKSAEIDTEKNTYSSDFADLEFQFPTNWEVKDEEDLKYYYSIQNISSRLYENNLFVYDVYAVDSFTGACLYISFYNADCFDEYEDINEFNETVKEETMTLDVEYDVEYAEDSTITINGVEYSQLAARISNGVSDSYSYDFTRYVDGYYMQINVFAYDIETVGSVIDFLNNK